MITLIERIIAFLIFIILIPFVVFKYKRFKFNREIFVINHKNQCIKIKYFRFSKSQQKLRMINFFFFFIKIAQNKISLTGNYTSFFFDRQQLYNKFNFGLISIYSIKKQMGIFTQQEEYKNTTNKNKLSIITKYILSSPYRSRIRKYKKTISIFDIDIINTNKSQALVKINKLLENNNKNYIAFVNAHCLNIAKKNEPYVQFLKNANLILPDGIGLKIYTNYLYKSKMICNLNGTDLMPLLFEIFAQKSISVYFVGGTPEHIIIAYKNLISSFPDLKVIGLSHGYQEDWGGVLEDIRSKSPDVIVIGMGTPKQEEWIDQNKDKLKFKLIIPVGGYFDFLSEKNKRADIWVREIGLEWIYRLYLEPSRLWKRYLLGNFLFLYSAWLWKTKNKGRN